MSKELLLVAEVVSNEKGVDKKIVFNAICSALESATKRKMDVDWDIKINMDTASGNYTTHRRWLVVNDEAFEDGSIEISLSNAKKKDTSYNINDFITEEIESIDFGRIAAQAAKQVIMHKVREAERDLIVQQYQEKLNTLVTGTVKKAFRDGVIIDLGGNREALLDKNNMLPQDSFRIGDRARAFLFKVENQQKGPLLFVSRTHTKMLVELFKIEVPEIGEDIIEIKSAARDPGSRSKIAVKTNDGRIDPIGACVGMRGSRVQAVSSELCGERIDIIQWDSDDLQMVVNALAPAEVASIVIDEDAKSMDIAVHEEQLAQVIGRSGQNVKLASKLTGWVLNIMSENNFDQRSNSENDGLIELFINKLDIDAEVAKLLVGYGFSNIEELAYVPEEELSSVEEEHIKVLSELRAKAQNILLTSALVIDYEISKANPSEDLLILEGMDEDLAKKLASKGVITAEDLAECSVDELVEKVGIDDEKASEIIMKAREPWFEGGE